MHGYYQPCGSVLYRLQASHQPVRQAVKYCVAIVQAVRYKRLDIYFVAPLGVWFWLHERRENFILLDRITILRFFSISRSYYTLLSYSVLLAGIKYANFLMLTQ